MFSLFSARRFARMLGGQTDVPRAASTAAPANRAVGPA